MADYKNYLAVNILTEDKLVISCPSSFKKLVNFLGVNVGPSATYTLRLPCSSNAQAILEPLAAAHNSVGKLYYLNADNGLLLCANICNGSNNNKAIFLMGCLFFGSLLFYSSFVLFV